MLIQTGGSAPRQNLQVSFPPSRRGCLVLFLVLFFKEKKKKKTSKSKFQNCLLFIYPSFFFLWRKLFLFLLSPLICYRIEPKGLEQSRQASKRSTTEPHPFPAFASFLVNKFLVRAQIGRPTSLFRSN